MAIGILEKCVCLLAKQESEWNDSEEMIQEAMDSVNWDTQWAAQKALLILEWKDFGCQLS